MNIVNSDISIPDVTFSDDANLIKEFIYTHRYDSNFLKRLTIKIDLYMFLEVLLYITSKDHKWICVDDIKHICNNKKKDRILDDYDLYSYLYDMACEYGYISVVNLFYIYYKKSDTTILSNGYVEACRCGHMNIVNFLFNRVDMRTEEENGFNCFTVACYYGKIDVVKFFINNIENINEVNKSFMDDDDINDGFICSCMNGSVHITRLLKDRFNISQTCINEAFIKACMHEEVESARLLLSYGANPDYINEDHESGYDAVVKYKLYEIINMM